MLAILKQYQHNTIITRNTFHAGSTGVEQPWLTVHACAHKHVTCSARYARTESRMHIQTCVCLFACGYVDRHRQEQRHGHTDATTPQTLTRIQRRRDADTHTTHTHTHTIPKFPRKDSKPKKRLRENRAITHIKDNNTHGIALFVWSIFLGLESLLRNYWITTLVLSLLSSLVVVVVVVVVVGVIVVILFDVERWSRRARWRSTTARRRADPSTNQLHYVRVCYIILQGIIL